MAYLLLGFTFGGLLLINIGIPISTWIWSLLPAHIEFLLIGWVVQIVIGVAFWILPRFSLEPRRGKESLAWLAIILLNLGIFLIGSSPLISISVWFTTFGILSQAVAGFTFVLYAWPRIKPAGA
jgi:hypothetical protein